MALYKEVSTCLWPWSSHPRRKDFVRLVTTNRYVRTCVNNKIRLLVNKIRLLINKIWLLIRIRLLVNKIRLLVNKIRLLINKIWLLIRVVLLTGHPAARQQDPAAHPGGLAHGAQTQHAAAGPGGFAYGACGPASTRRHDFVRLVTTNRYVRTCVNNKDHPATCSSTRSGCSSTRSGCSSGRSCSRGVWTCKVIRRPTRSAQDPAARQQDPAAHPGGLAHGAQTQHPAAGPGGFAYGACGPASTRRPGSTPEGVFCDFIIRGHQCVGDLERAQDVAGGRSSPDWSGEEEGINRHGAGHHRAIGSVWRRGINVRTQND
ncbi:uncharacterized protein LOC119769506 [Culex quinquefasciatus]|uniref:uncharacterized protein LOC119769506 n=1 Tax=Culex quinquefasciatus TaxID=7176 RepID=UPI0018E2A7FF|nr:uncharacterized protein LOC119769506 [Culex quinquefasciatus]